MDLSDRSGFSAQHSATLLALLVAIVAAATIASVWIFQHAGYTPCELCLKERVPFYIGLPLALVTALVARRASPTWAAGLFAVLAAIFACGALLAAYHAGVEWGFWPGPDECSGAAHTPTSVDDFRQQLEHVVVVRCDVAALRIFGLSFAGWNVLVSLGLALVAVVGFRQARHAAANTFG